jgi:hypothetical protein
VVLVSVLIGLRLQGVIGAIFAIPVAAVISAFFFHYLNRSQGGPRDVASRAARRLEQREGRPVRVPTPPPVGAPTTPAAGAPATPAAGVPGVPVAPVISPGQPHPGPPRPKETA